MKMDVSKFKKVSSDDKKTVFKHPRGHLIEVAHAALSPSYRKQLKDLPGYADGGEVSKAEKAGEVAADALASPFRAIRDYVYDPIKENVINPAGDALAQGLKGAGNKLGMLEPPPDGPAPASIAPGSLSQPLAQSLAPTPQDSGPDFGKMLSGSIGAYGKGVDAQAKAEGELGQKQAADLDQQQAEMRALYQETMAHYQNYMKEADAIAKDVMSGHINPNHYMESMSSGKKVASAIGLILGGMGAGLTGGENPALKYLNSQIERDVEAQKANLSNKATLMGHFVRQGESVQNAANLTRGILANIYTAKIEAEAARSKSPIAAAAAQQAKAKLLMDHFPQFQAAAQQSALAKVAATNPMAAIMVKVPKEMHAEAVKELGAYQKTKSAVDQIGRVIDGFGKVGVADRANPFGPDKIKQGKAALVPLVKSVLGEAIHEADIERMVDPFVPGILNNNEKVRDASKREFTQMLLSKAAGSYPTLEGYGIVAPIKPPAETKTVNGVKYMRGPNGEAIRVK